MQLFTISAGQIASSVWANAAKTLTSLSGTYSAVHAVKTTLANGATLDLRPAVNQLRSLMVALTTGTSGQIEIWDGNAGNAVGIVVIGAGTSGQYNSVASDSSVGVRLNNTGGTSDTYMYCAIDRFVG